MTKAFPKSTVGAYMTGVGMTLTRANIRAEQMRRAKNGQTPANAVEVVTAFTRPPYANADWRPSPRHLGRAYRLLRHEG